MARRARRGGAGFDAWPGYVDALSTLLMVIIFALLVFALGQGFLSAALSTRDRALDALRQELAALSATLAQQRQAAAQLEGQLAARETEQGAAAARLAALEPSLAAAEARAREAALRAAGAEALVARMREELAAAQSLRAAAEARLGTAAAEAEAARAEAQRLRAVAEAGQRDQATLAEAARTDAQRLAAAEGEAAALRRDLAALVALRDAAEAQLRQEAAATAAAHAEAQRLAEALAREARQRAAAETRAGALDPALADAEGRARAAAALADASRAEAAELRAALAAARALAEARGAEAAERRGTLEGAAREQARLAEAARAQAGLLGQQLGELRAQIARLVGALEEAESRERAGEIERAELRTQLDAATLARVEELQRYRSEFFGRLREALGDRPELRVVGDRFVFASEVLFPSASADLTAAGRAEVRALAAVLAEIGARIPPDVPWLLRVDGHADRSPLRRGRFANNWELSAARALAVANLLIESGLPPERVAAAAFGEFQPLDPANTPEARARNRRIELRLTDR
ncbi:MAG: OmpA family protein [Rubritepida sp.]|nr:OmpA family protein [Rubritepida sp.]